MSTPSTPTNSNEQGNGSYSMFRSPAEIPPRTSSSNAASAYPGPVPATLQSAPGLKSALRAVPEGDFFPDLASAVAGGPCNSPRSARKASNASAIPPSILNYLTSFQANMSQPPQPPPDPNRYATEDFNFSARRTWSEAKEKVLTGPFDYLDAHPGKDIRSQLIKAFDMWLKVPPESLQVITKVVGMLHTASLLIDDVEDNSFLRRGFPVAHTIFGVPQTINSSNYVYFCALQELQKLHNQKIQAIFAEELMNLHRGQGMDLYWRDTLTCPTEEDYLEMVGNKTGGLFRLGVKLMQAESRCVVDCVPLVNLIGFIFQIQDDYRNLRSRQYTDNKGMCEDLTEGKFSFPIIHSIRADPTNLQLLNILKQKTENEEIKRYAVMCMESTGSFEYTQKVVQVLIERARRLVEELDAGLEAAGHGMHTILDKLAI